MAKGPNQLIMFHDVDDNSSEPREMLDLTISVDHDIVDGAPAARFARRLAKLMERADGF